MDRHLKLTKKEEEIMAVLWDAGRPLIASEISGHAESIGMKLKPTTVVGVVKKLKKDGVITVAEIKYSNTVLAQAYVPTMSADDFALERIKGIIGDGETEKNASFLLSLMSDSIPELNQDDLDKLSSTIEELREK